uniref:Interleukin-10 receptor subunit beta n=1 Tax=Oncorhynchus kisutch TaxID=8019 RepID=A0A8C7HMB3_ONCKI
GNKIVLLSSLYAHKKSSYHVCFFHSIAESLLPQPQNVEVVSYNMDAIVKWDAPLTSLKDLTYTAEYTMPSTDFFYTVCNATKEHRCDFGKLPSCHGNYKFRVRIELEGNTSSWAETPNFSLKKGTIFGPPNVTLVTKGGAIGAVEVNIQNPVLKISSLKEAYSKVEYNIRYWKKTDKKDVRETYDSQTHTHIHTHILFTLSVQNTFLLSHPLFLSRYVQVQALAGPLKDIKRLVQKPLLRCFVCVLSVIVLLEGVPSPQSEVLSALEKVVIKDLSVLCSVHLSLDPD